MEPYKIACGFVKADKEITISNELQEFPAAHSHILNAFRKFKAFW